MIQITAWRKITAAAFPAADIAYILFVVVFGCILWHTFIMKNALRQLVNIELSVSKFQ